MTWPARNDLRLVQEAVRAGDVSFADRRQAMAGVRAAGLDEAEGLALVGRLVLGLDVQRHFVRARHLPAWEQWLDEYRVEDERGRAWTLALFVDDGNLVVFRAECA